MSHQPSQLPELPAHQSTVEAYVVRDFNTRHHAGNEVLDACGEYFTSDQMRAYAKLAIASVKREPPDNHQINAAFEESMRIRPKEATNAETRLLFARAIEAAHGITGRYKELK